MVVSVEVGCPCDRGADWEWHLAAAQHLVRALYRVLLALDRIHIRNSKYGFH